MKNAWLIVVVIALVAAYFYWKRNTIADTEANRAPEDAKKESDYVFTGFAPFSYGLTPKVNEEVAKVADSLPYLSSSASSAHGQLQLMS
jgi:hypothetical protein